MGGGLILQLEGGGSVLVGERERERWAMCQGILRYVLFLWGVGVMG